MTAGRQQEPLVPAGFPPGAGCPRRLPTRAGAQVPSLLHGRSLLQLAQMLAPPVVSTCSSATRMAVVALGRAPHAWELRSTAWPGDSTGGD